MFTFGGAERKLAYQDFLTSSEQAKTYIASLIICNGSCYKDATALKTAQIQFNIVPQSNGSMHIENLKYRLLDENTLDLYAIQQPQSSLMTSNRIAESRIDIPTSFEMLDENRRIFEFSIEGNPLKDEISFSKLQIAFSEHGQWFTSLSQDVLMAGTRVVDQTSYNPLTGFSKARAFSGIAFNLDQSMQEQFNTFDVASYKDTYMSTKKFSSMFNASTIKHGLYSPIGKSNAFGYGYTENSAEFSLGDNAVYRTAGVFVIDPSATFALGME